MRALARAHTTTQDSCLSHSRQRSTAVTTHETLVASQKGDNGFKIGANYKFSIAGDVVATYLAGKCFHVLLKSTVLIHSQKTRTCSPKSKVAINSSYVVAHEHIPHAW